MFTREFRAVESRTLACPHKSKKQVLILAAAQNVQVIVGMRALSQHAYVHAFHQHITNWMLVITRVSLASRTHNRLVVVHVAQQTRIPLKVMQIHYPLAVT